MPDDLHPMPRREPEDIDLAAIKTDLEFLMERVSEPPTRKELTLRPLLIIAGSAGLVIAWIELFGRVCL
jgi:hypothetical protein